MNAIERLWIDPSPVAVPDSLLKETGGDTFLAEALLRRGIGSPAEARVFLNPDLYLPAAPVELPDLEIAADRIQTAIQKGERIGVWGDFDVDGQTATTLLVSSLRRLGAETIYHIPIRASESHGVNIGGLQRMLAAGARLIVTCDTGITANDAVQYANQQRIDVIITDHHTLPQQLPPAFAIVNPQRLSSGHPLFYLCGVGCAFKLVEELHRQAGRLQELDRDLDLVALGTIADLAVLKRDNRFLVWKGLQEIRNTQRPALSAILETTNTKPDDLTEEQISFLLAPRLNALGRLGDANSIVEFFQTADMEQARVFAMQLEGLNARRKLLCDQVFQAAQIQIENNPAWLDLPVLVLNHPEWPAGVIGIVASRLVEQYHRPVVLLSNPPGEIARGSARSVEGIHITEAIASASRLLVGFGGHPMAAGLGIQSENIPEFRRELSQTVAQMIQKTPLKVQTVIDAYVPLRQLSLNLVKSIDRLSPFGPGNPPVTLAASGLKIKGLQIIGRGNEHLKVIVEDDTGAEQAIIKWNGAGLALPDGRFDLAYTARAVNFRGQRELQITWIDERITEEVIRVEPVAKPKATFIDLRQIQDPEEAFRQLEHLEGVLIWREGEPSEDIPGIGRHNLTACATLALWNSPPGKDELVSIIKSASPAQVVLLALAMPIDHPNVFLTRLSGLVKHIIAARQGYAPFPELVGATNQREATVKLGLEWLSAKGLVEFSIEPDQRLKIFSPGRAQLSRLPEIERTLTALLKETAAFREYYRRAEPDQLSRYIDEENA
ncbi:MAG: single-stranded-DNA-specific exonuclease RecJ [Anaerolineae bacterium]|nr:single-stranded-DNA-specific exonuclease RecJ [Anaerolineae bacterium]